MITGQKTPHGYFNVHFVYIHITLDHWKAKHPREFFFLDNMVFTLIIAVSFPVESH